MTVLGVATLCAFTACQTSQTQPSKHRFEKVDSSKDGKISRDEGNDYYVTRIFKSRDLNDDGKMTWEEWNVQGANVSKERFYKYDADKNGSISLDEARVYGRQNKLLNQAFDEGDKDKDGFLSRDEAIDFYGSKEGAPN